MRNYFWPGIGLGVVAGALVGMKIKGEQKQLRRNVHKAKRNMEDLLDNMGL